MSSSSSELQVAVGMPFDCHDKRIPVCRPMYLFLSSCTRPLSYEGRPCGFGLGRLIVWSIFHFFFGRTKKIVKSQRPDNFFCPLSWLFFVQSLIRGWPIFKKDWTKEIQESGKKNCPVSETGQFFWLTPEKWEIDRTIPFHVLRLQIVIWVGAIISIWNVVICFALS